VSDRIDLRARVVKDLAEVSRIEPSWWALLERAANPEPTKTPLWLLTWWDVFGRSGGRELCLVVLEDKAGEVVGIVPLLRRWVMDAKLFPVQTLELIGSGEDREDEIFSEYLGAIVARGHEAAVAKKLAEMLRGADLGAWDELVMRSMRSDDPWVALLADELRARGMEVNVESSLECPYIALPATWDAYLAGLDGNNRYFVRRTLRELDAWAKPGGAVLRRASTPTELDEGWRILQAIHSERWNGGGSFQSERFRRFHRTVMRELLDGKGGTLDLLWLEVKGEPVAAVYNIVYRGHIHFYQSGRKLDVPKNARPGIAIHLLAIRRAIEQGHHTYDFLASPHQYKHQLAPKERRHLVTLSAVGPSLRARLSSRARREARLLLGRVRELRERYAPPAAQPAPPGAQPAPPEARPAPPEAQPVTKE
jgi:CelD/BcsL family acetyltransferase involved in cellulose biosynthesis